MSVIELSIDELEKATGLLLRKIRQTGGNTIEISEDTYWYIAGKARYDVSNAVEAPTIGSIADNVEEIRTLLKDDSSSVVPHDLDALANVLLAVSYELEKK